ncbi:MAG: hypothetical protein Q9207_004130 [Kuettlingeria erythrocarpa]
MAQDIQCRQITKWAAVNRNPGHSLASPGSRFYVQRGSIQSSLKNRKSKSPKNKAPGISIHSPLSDPKIRAPQLFISSCRRPSVARPTSGFTDGSPQTPRHRNGRSSNRRSSQGSSPNGKKRNLFQTAGAPATVRSASTKTNVLPPAFPSSPTCAITPQPKEKKGGGSQSPVSARPSNGKSRRAKGHHHPTPADQAIQISNKPSCEERKPAMSNSPEVKARRQQPPRKVKVMPSIEIDHLSDDILGGWDHPVVYDGSYLAECARDDVENGVLPGTSPARERDESFVPALSATPADSKTCRSKNGQPESSRSLGDRASRTAVLKRSSSPMSRATRGLTAALEIASTHVSSSQVPGDDDVLWGSRSEFLQAEARRARYSKDLVTRLEELVEEQRNMAQASERERDLWFRRGQLMSNLVLQLYRGEPLKMPDGTDGMDSYEQMARTLLAHCGESSVKLYSQGAMVRTLAPVPPVSNPLNHKSANLEITLELEREPSRMNSRTDRHQNHCLSTAKQQPERTELAQRPTLFRARSTPPVAQQQRVDLLFPKHITAPSSTRARQVADNMGPIHKLCTRPTPTRRSPRSRFHTDRPQQRTSLVNAGKESLQSSTQPKSAIEDVSHGSGGSAQQTSREDVVVHGAGSCVIPRPPLRDEPQVIAGPLTPPKKIRTQNEQLGKEKGKAVEQPSMSHADERDHQEQSASGEMEGSTSKTLHGPVSHPPDVDSSRKAARSNSEEARSSGRESSDLPDINNLFVKTSTARPDDFPQRTEEMMSTDGPVPTTMPPDTVTLNGKRARQTALASNRNPLVTAEVREPASKRRCHQISAALENISISPDATNARSEASVRPAQVDQQTEYGPPPREEPFLRYRKTAIDTTILSFPNTIEISSQHSRLPTTSQRNDRRAAPKANSDSCKRKTRSMERKSSDVLKGQPPRDLSMLSLPQGMDFDQTTEVDLAFATDFLAGSVVQHLQAGVSHPCEHGTIPARSFYGKDASRPQTRQPESPSGQPGAGEDDKTDRTRQPTANIKHSVETQQHLPPAAERPKFKVPPGRCYVAGDTFLPSLGLTTPLCSSSPSQPKSIETHQNQDDGYGSLSPRTSTPSSDKLFCTPDKNKKRKHSNSPVTPTPSPKRPRTDCIDLSSSPSNNSTHRVTTTPGKELATPQSQVRRSISLDNSDIRPNEQASSPPRSSSPVVNDDDARHLNDRQLPDWSEDDYNQPFILSACSSASSLTFGKSSTSRIQSHTDQTSPSLSQAKASSISATGQGSQKKPSKIPKPPENHARRPPSFPLSRRSRSNTEGIGPSLDPIPPGAPPRPTTIRLTMRPTSHNTNSSHPVLPSKTELERTRQDLANAVGRALMPLQTNPLMVKYRASLNLELAAS